MTTLDKKYFTTLEEAKKYANEQYNKYKEQYNIENGYLLQSNVWGATEERHFENGLYCPYVVITDIQPY